ncbi:DoxX family protein [Natronomonas amylolytica]|uniref:DoxX family protein n=1 Tax=Natronomonas amylolytica TaxID=3108498 RepID=UPI003009AA00
MDDGIPELLARLKLPLCYAMGGIYVIAGIMHFVAPESYVQIVPPSLPAPLALVYLSGVAEVGLGLGVLHPRTRPYAAWGLVALLLAIFPANVYMATSGVVIEGASAPIRDPSPLARWARLPMQVVLIAWAWWYTTPMPDGD